MNTYILWASAVLTASYGAYRLYKIYNDPKTKIVMSTLKFLLRGSSDNTASSVVHNTYVSISYSRLGIKFHMVLPYDKTLISKHMGSRVYLVMENTKIDITHQPGIPYCFSAKELGGSCLIYVDRDGKSKQLGPDQKIN